MTAPLQAHGLPEARQPPLPARMPDPVNTVSPVALTIFSGIGGTSRYALTAIHIRMENPSISTIMTEFLQHGESTSVLSSEDKAHPPLP